MGSGFKNFGAGSVLTASDVNNYLMEQSVMYFASTTARDTAVTSPEDGMVVYVGSNDSSEGLYTYNGSAWRKGPGWNAPWGVVGHYSTTSDYNRSTGTMAEINTAFRLTVSTAANRYLRFIFVANYSNSTGGGIVEVYNNTTSATIGRVFQFNSTIGDGIGVTGSLVSTSASTSTVYTVRFQNVTSGTFNVSGSVTPTQFTIEDLGPAGAPA